LEDPLEIKDYKIFIGTKDISNDPSYGGFTVNGTYNTLKYTFDNAKVSEIYGKQVILQINAKIRNGITDAYLMSKYGSLDIPNEGSTSYTAVPTGGGPGVPGEEDSNIVIVTPPDDKIIDKTVEEEGYPGDGRDIELTNRASEFAYTVEARVPVSKAATMTSMVISDRVENALVVNSVTVEFNGVDITNNPAYGALTKTSQSPGTGDVIQENYTNVVYSFKDGFDFSAYGGKDVVMKIKACTK